jgi:hypothetical protein
MRSSLRVQFIHGLESSPQGAKARFLAEHFEALTPTMNTRDFEGCIQTQCEAMSVFAPDVLVGSSFGGAVAVALLGRRLWRGPTVLLCPASVGWQVPNTLPDDAVVTVVHGARDEVVPLEHSQALVVGCAPPRVTLLTVDDDHRLNTLITTQRLTTLIEETWRVAHRSA